MSLSTTSLTNNDIGSYSGNYNDPSFDNSNSVASANNTNTKQLESGAESPPTLIPIKLAFLDESDTTRNKLNKKNQLAKASALSKFPHSKTLQVKEVGPYKLSKTIGSGSTGKVKIGYHKDTNEKMAIKIVDRRPVDPKLMKESTESKEQRILREAAILNLLKHPHIVSLHDMYVTKNYFFLIFEHVDGGQLLDFILEKKRLKEDLARKIFRQILSAVDYCHENGIVHRDLKIENILLDSEQNIKLIDFGLSNFYDSKNLLKTFCGSLYFAAPELLCGKPYVGPEVDVWSLAVILFVLVSGRVPFEERQIQVLHEKIKSGKYEMPPHLSPSLKSLISRMLVVDSRKRATIKEVMRHVWVLGDSLGPINNYLQTINRNPIDFVDENMIDLIEQSFSHQFDRTLIEFILKRATVNWADFCHHPIVNLYYLCKEKIRAIETEPNIPVTNERNQALTPVENTENDPLCDLATTAKFIQQFKRKAHNLQCSSPTCQEGPYEIPLTRIESLPASHTRGLSLSFANHPDIIELPPQIRRYSYSSSSKTNNSNKLIPLKDDYEGNERNAVMVNEKESSLNATPSSQSPCLGDSPVLPVTEQNNTIYPKVKNYLLKGLFSTIQFASCNGDVVKLRKIIYQTLTSQPHIDYEIKESSIMCQVILDRNRTFLFEIILVKNVFGHIGIQYRKILGDNSLFKAFVNDLTSAMRNIQLEM